MNLREYLTQAEISNTEFAAKVGLSRSFVGKLAAGERTAHPKTAQHISKATGGAVSVLTLLGLEETESAAQ